MCYLSPNWFKNSESLRWQVDDLLFIFELRQRRCHPLIWCCVMKRFPCWRLFCFLILITKLQHLLSVRLWSLSCHKPSKWSRRCSWVCVNYFHMMLQAHKVLACTYVTIHSLLNLCSVYGCLEVNGQTALENLTPEPRSSDLVRMVASHPSHFQTQTRTNIPSAIL